MMSMKTTASNLKARLGRFMKAVRAGREVLITDRGEPVAKLVPLAVEDRRPTLVIRPPHPDAPAWRDVVVDPVRVDDGRTSLDYLREDRDR